MTLVTVPVIVSTAQELSPADFRVYANGLLQPVQHLWREADLPLTLGIIIDISESQRHQAAEHERAAEQFLRRMVRPQDRAFVVAVNENVILKAQVRGGPGGLRYTVLPAAGEPLGVPCGSLHGEHGRKRPICGGTALWNAIYASAHDKLTTPEGSKALIVLSDGIDTGSTHTLDAAIEELHQTGTAVYAISYPGGTDGLKRLTEETGGLLLDPSGENYDAVFSLIEADLRNRYILGFAPRPATTRRTPIRVEATLPGLRVRTARQYFEP